MKFSCCSFYFVITVLMLIASFGLCQNKAIDESNQLESEDIGNRFVRYIKHRDRFSEHLQQDAKQTPLVKDEKDCNKAANEGGTMFKHFDWFKNFLHRQHENNDKVALRKVEKEKEKYNEEVEEDDDRENIDYVNDSEDDESKFDEREDSDFEEGSKVVRSVDSSYLDPRSTETCEEGTDCNNKNNGRSYSFMDSSAGNSKKTSNIALKAAQEAKAAEDAQETAGKEASKQAKFQLAEKAIQAAKAAQAALSAKQAIVEQMERELRESEIVVQDLSSSIQQSEANANAALRAAQQAATQLKMLTEAVQMSQGNLGNSEQAAQGAQQELSEKTQLLEAAKNRVEALLREIKTARADYANTKQAAYKAASAAKQAKTNAARVRRNDERNDSELMQTIIEYMNSHQQ